MVLQARRLVKKRIFPVVLLFLVQVCCGIGLMLLRVEASMRKEVSTFQIVDLSSRVLFSKSADGCSSTSSIQVHSIRSCKFRENGLHE